VTVSDILSTRQGSKYSEEDVRRVVSNCSKSRFALQEDPQTGILQIRANQGHTMQVGTKGTTFLLIWVQKSIIIMLQLYQIFRGKC
jgi:RNA:NAD 2'-phosphotransferase (TPT1/KptA family)